MNGRMYDAKLRRFLSPDNFIQDPFNTQSFNRYGYVWNNPLSYNDPTGELGDPISWVAIAIVAAFTYLKGAHDNRDANGDWNFNPFSWDQFPSIQFGTETSQDANGDLTVAGNVSITPTGTSTPINIVEGEVTIPLTKREEEHVQEIRQENIRNSSPGYTADPIGEALEAEHAQREAEQYTVNSDDVINTEISDPWLGVSIITGTLLADDVSGIGVADDLAIPIVLAGAARLDLTQRIHVTYTLSNPNGQTYVGRTSGFADPVTLVNRRFATHHMRAFGFTNPRIDAAVQGYQGYPAIRGREQQLIDHYGGVDSPNVGNRIRGVSRYNPLGRVYHNASNVYFGTLHQYTGY